MTSIFARSHVSSTSKHSSKATYDGQENGCGLRHSSSMSPTAITYGHSGTTASCKTFFAIQDEITESIVKMLRPTLLGNQQAATRRHTENLDAFELYLKGRYMWVHRMQGPLRASIGYYEKAIALDPNYALAHAGLADSLALLRAYGYVRTREVKARADAAARRAMELDPSLAEAHFASALHKLFLTEDCGRRIRRAVEISPRNPLFQSAFRSDVYARLRVVPGGLGRHMANYQVGFTRLKPTRIISH